MSFTIGTALVDARDHKLPVELLVEGHWICGRVVAVDGFGVVVRRDDERQAVVRVESVSVVNVDETDRVARGPEPFGAARHMAVAQ
jgi:hypothetical protein